MYLKKKNWIWFYELSQKYVVQIVINECIKLYKQTCNLNRQKLLDMNLWFFSYSKSKTFYSIMYALLFI